MRLHLILVRHPDGESQIHYATFEKDDSWGDNLESALADFGVSDVGTVTVEADKGVVERAFEQGC